MLLTLTKHQGIVCTIVTRWDHLKIASKRNDNKITPKHHRSTILKKHYKPFDLEAHDVLYSNEREKKDWLKRNNSNYFLSIRPRGSRPVAHKIKSIFAAKSSSFGYLFIAYKNIFKTWFLHKYKMISTGSIKMCFYWNFMIAVEWGKEDAC